MKRVLIPTLVVGLLVGALTLSSNQKTAKPELQVAVEDRNPWTSLRMNDAPETFHFVVVSDRTGGHRPRIFSQAVEQINLLQPAFVVSVGDLIEGYSTNRTELASQWKEFQTYTHKLNMPFFYAPGNHDVANAVESDVWKERFGRRYYHFLYKDALFLVLNSDDPHEDKTGKLSPEQIAYFQQVLSDNPNPRWTFVFLHKPVWTQTDLDTNGWLDVEKALNGRSYTVFCGHIHRYQKFVRQGMNYYQLATTGGGSRMRGMRYGEFDHIAWVSMKKASDPVIANLLLDGIYNESLHQPVTAEDGYPGYNRKPPHPVRGVVTFNGMPVADAQIIYWLPNPKDNKKTTKTADAWVEADGSYSMSTYRANDGVPEGDYRVTITLRKPPLEASGKPGADLLPKQYANPATTELRATVKSGTNVIDWNLTTK